MGQQPRFDSPLLAPVVATMTPVLQKPWSHVCDDEAAKRKPPEHDVQKLHGPEAAQHWAKEPLRESVAGKSQLRRSETEERASVECWAERNGERRACGGPARRDPSQHRWVR